MTSSSSTVHDLLSGAGCPASRAGLANCRVISRLGHPERDEEDVLDPLSCWRRKRRRAAPHSGGPQRDGRHVGCDGVRACRRGSNDPASKGSFSAVPPGAHASRRATISAPQAPIRDKVQDSVTNLTEKLAVARPQ
jgi:hypothetical protein